MPHDFPNPTGWKLSLVIPVMRGATTQWARHFRRGEFADAEQHFRRSIERLTRRNPNPADGEPHYTLGLALNALNSFQEEAYAAFYKATWNYAWQAAGYHALAELDCRKSEWTTALEHLDRSLGVNTDNLRARNLRAMVLRKLGQSEESDLLPVEMLALDPLDWWARFLKGEELNCICKRGSIYLDFARAGFHEDAIKLLKAKTETVLNDPRDLGAAPLVGCYLGWLYQQIGRAELARKAFGQAAKAVFSTTAFLPVSRRLPS